MSEHHTSVAPRWCSARTPNIALRIWLADRTRHHGSGLIEALSRLLWP